MAERHLRAVDAQPVRTVVDSAEDAFLAGDFDLCGALLNEAEPAGAERGRAMLVAARLARVENRVADQYAAAAEAVRLHPARAGRIVATALQASAAPHLGHVADAERLIATLEAEGDERLPALARYLHAADAWSRGDYERAKTLAMRNIAAGEQVGESYSLLGWIENRQGRITEAVPHFLASLATFRDVRGGDQRCRAMTLAGFAGTAAETIDLSLAPVAWAEFARIAWLSGLRAAKFQTLMALRQVALIEGDLERVWILARDAIGVAPTRAHRAIGEVFGAMACRLIGDNAAASMHFDLAWNILRDESWGQFDSEERFALTYFASEAAFDRPAESRKALTVYRSVTAKDFPLLILTDSDRRVLAYAATAFGRVAEADGDAAAAIAYYKDSLDAWRQVGFRFRAAIAGSDLLRLTGDPSYREPIDAALALAPNGVFRG